MRQQNSPLPFKWRELRLFLIALVLLWQARLRLGVIGFGDPRTKAEPISTGPPASPAFARRVHRAISHGARFTPGAACLVQAIAGRKLLALKGHSSRIVVGVRNSRADSLEAHAWLVSGDLVVLGGTVSELEQFAPIIGAT